MFALEKEESRFPEVLERLELIPAGKGKSSELNYFDDVPIKRLKNI